jgi:NAD(P)H dehydrogenase (quinone)
MKLKVLIAFHSDYGSTKKMAESIAAGIRAAAPSTTVSLKQATDTALEDLTAADVLIFGTPVHMGSMAWQMNQLIDRSAKLWMENALEGKVGGVFVSGSGFGGAGGGAELTMACLHANFLEHGMVVVGFPKTLHGYAHGGIHWGPYARTSNHEGMPEGIKDEQLAACRSYGSHIIDIAERLIGSA